MVKQYVLFLAMLVCLQGVISEEDIPFSDEMLPPEEATLCVLCKRFVKLLRDEHMLENMRQKLEQQCELAGDEKLCIKYIEEFLDAAEHKSPSAACQVIHVCDQSENAL